MKRLKCKGAGSCQGGSKGRSGGPRGRRVEGVSWRVHFGKGRRKREVKGRLQQVAENMSLVGQKICNSGS